MADVEANEKSIDIHNMPGKRSISPVDLTGKRASVSSTRAAKKILEHSNDADEAMKAFANGEVVEVDEATNKRLLRIIDWHLIPLMCLVYGLNYLDKTTLSYASIMGIKKDIGLVGDDYQWLGSMFYFGYLGFEYPTSRLLQRLPLAKYSAFCVIMWGTILALFATVSNFGGAVCIRCMSSLLMIRSQQFCGIFSLTHWTQSSSA
jgi:MFS transporter, ACS family, allantoate permease